MKDAKMKHPLLNAYKASDFETSIKSLIPSYLPAWKPTENEAGWAIAKAFSKISEQVAEQLNAVPEKLFLSYLDLLEIQPKEAEPSLTPVQFTLRKKGANAVRIPEKSQLMSQSKATFETKSEFTAQKATLIASYFVNNEKDTIIDIGSQLEAQKDAPFDANDSLQAHELYIRDDKLFLFKKNRGREQYINLRIPYLQNIHPKKTKWFYWGVDKKDTQRWIAFEVSLEEKEICLKKKIPSPSMPTTVNGENGYWIKAIINKVTQPIGVELFKINFDSKSGLDSSFTNDVPIDLEKSFYPFGEEPQLEDVWYLASDEAFSKSGHSVKLYFNDIASLKPKGIKVTLSWEYNDGKTWQQLDISDFNGGIAFTVPNKINLFEQNDIKSYWIRVRIVAGGYAETTLNTAQVITKESTEHGVTTTTFDITQNVLTPNYKAPKLTSNGIKVQGLIKSFKNITINNNYNYETYNHIPNPIFRRLDREGESLYLGFDNPFESGLVSLFFTVAMRQIKISRTIHCFYADKNNSWSKLKIEDETQALQKNGTLSFLDPNNQRAYKLFNTLAYWIKIRLITANTLESTQNNTNPSIKSASFFDIPLGDNDQGDVIKGIYPNTVWATYHHGGEVGANGEAHTLDKLITTIPAIKEVSNPLPITGGAKAESNEELINKAPAKIRHRNSAINQQDIEALVYEVSRNIARVKLFLSLDKQGQYHSGGNTIVLLPFLDEPMPKPSFMLRQKVEAYLHSKISALSLFEVIAPEYVRINITATLHTRKIAYANRIEEDTLSGLNSYLHPLSGKVDGSGWEFGESICLSDVIGWLEHIQSVEYISHIEVVMQSHNHRMILNHTKNSLVTLPPYALVASGVHKIQVKEI